MSEDALDRYTLAHVFVGVAFRAANVGLPGTMLSSVAWEAVEPALKSHFPGIFPNATPDSAQNKVADILAVGAGWWLAERFAPN